MRARTRAQTTSTESNFRVWTVLSGMLLTLALAGCDIPTEPPILESRWVVPAEETRFSVSELLPGDVSLTPDGSAFLIDFAPEVFSQSLADLCPVCTAANGFNAPKPPFTGGFQATVDFPAEVSAVTVLDGEVRVEIDNGLNFDPLNPASGVTGTATIDIVDTADDELLGSLTLDGASTALTPGSVTVHTVALLGASVEGGLEARVIVDSPLGDNVDIDTSLRFGVTATPQNIRVADVAVDVSGEAVNFDAQDLDVGELDENLTDQIVEGAFVVEVTNPFGVAADFTLTVDGPTIAPIQKSATITTDAQSSVRLEFTGDELRSFLGEPGIRLTGGATVSNTAGIITLTPGAELVLEANLDMTLAIGG